MFQLFKPHLHMTRGVIVPGQHDLIVKTYHDRLVFLQKYYRERTFYLRNNHLLVRLLVMGMGSFNTDYRTFVSSIADRTGMLVRHFQMTGPESYGKIWYGEFYGEGSTEVIVGTDEYFDIQNVVNNWKDISPVTVLTHPVSDLGLLLPNGKDNHYIDGLTVLHINIPMLFLQYRRFVEHQQKEAAIKGIEMIASPKLFLYRYVLPNMMASHIDHVFVNRMISLFEGSPMTVQIGRSPFFNAESGNETGGMLRMINTAQEIVLKKINNVSMYPDQTLMNIFTVFKPNALDLLEMPDIAPTRQVWWALLLSRLKYVKFLMELPGDMQPPGSRMYYNHAIIDYGRLLDSHVLERLLPAQFLEETISTIRTVLKLARA